VVDADVQRPHIDGLVNSVRVKVLLRSVEAPPHRYLLLIPVPGRSDRLVEVNGKAQKSISSCQSLSLESQAVVLGAVGSRKTFAPCLLYSSRGP
jgi:hypothetical protein